jgi:hypothetical protein
MAVACMVVYACSGPAPETKQENNGTEEETSGSNFLSNEDQVARGKYLVDGIGCGDCHSPKNMVNGGPVPDSERLLSGHPADAQLPPGAAEASKKGWVLLTMDMTAFVGPWGTSFAANLTPDTLTGIGTWTDEIWLRAFKGGKFHGLPAGRDILPPMPIPAFKNLTDEDALAIFAYLKSIKPVSNAVPAPVPPAGS